MAFPEDAPNHVCVCGGGPAGVVLSLVLARNGIPVTLLEGQGDFDRKFRGDTLHASSLEILAQLGLADAILERCNARVKALDFISADGQLTIAEFDRLNSPYPFIALIPQVKFLDRLVQEAGKCPGFRLLMNATVTDLLRDGERVTGVRYIHEGETKEMRAALIVGADGRGSTVRQKAGIELARTSPPMDVLWFSTPRDPDTVIGGGVDIRFGTGTMLITVDRGDTWQMGYIILKGSYRILREKGIEAFRAELRAIVPQLGSALASLKDWKQCAILSVVTGCVDRWHLPGLLLIGDAAHVMSPVFGVGINYAIQDAVAAANAITAPLLKESLRESDLAAVQEARERPARFILGAQSFVQRRIIAGALKSERPFHPPLPLRVLTRFAAFRRRAASFIAYGLRSERLQAELAAGTKDP